MKIRTLLLLFLPLLCSCTAVKPYQKIYLNDDDMVLSDRKVQAYGSDSATYREGAAGGNGGKIGAGCGCN